MNKVNKFSVLKFASVTFVFLVALLGTCFLMLTIFLPRVVADFSYDLGLKNFALHYYERTYNLNKSDDDLYNALSVAIIVEKHEKVVSLFEKFLECENYEKIILETDAKTVESNMSIVAKSTLINEKNYLINSYVSALIKTENLDSAVMFAYDNFNYEEIELASLGTYAFSNIFVSENISNDIVTSVLGVTVYEDVSLGEELYNYFNLLLQIFEENYLELENLTNLQKSHMLYLGRRINLVANDLTVVSTKIEPILLNEEVSLLAMKVTERLANLL